MASKRIESEEHCFWANATICGNVVLPYSPGSRVPRRLRFGPLIKRIDFAMAGTVR